MEFSKKVNYLLGAQTRKFTFRSKILRDLIKHQVKVNKGKNLEALDIARHYVNSKGVQPYKELWQVIANQINKETCIGEKWDSKKQMKYHKKAHEVYKNIINRKIYSYTIQMILKDFP